MWTIIILATILIISIYFNFNLLRKVEILEEASDISYMENKTLYTYIFGLQKEVEDTLLMMKQIDRLGAFSSDDEVGAIFKRLNDLLLRLNKFLVIDEKNDE